MEAAGLAAGKRNAPRLGAHIVFVDESGFSVIGGLTIGPKRRRLSLYFRLHPKNIFHQEGYDFLWHLLRYLYAFAGYMTNRINPLHPMTTYSDGVSASSHVEVPTRRGLRLAYSL